MSDRSGWSHLTAPRVQRGTLPVGDMYHGCFFFVFLLFLSARTDVEYMSVPDIYCRVCEAAATAFGELDEQDHFLDEHRWLQRADTANN